MFKLDISPFDQKFKKNFLIYQKNTCSLFIRDCSDCQLVVACQQFRTRDCKRIQVIIVSYFKNNKKTETFFSIFLHFTFLSSLKKIVLLQKIKPINDGENSV